jgi:SAM-dependent methyltransferase
LAAVSIKDRVYRNLDLGAQFAWRDIRRALRDCRTVLDLGCGPASPVRYLPRPERLVGVDGHGPAVEESRRMGIHDEYVVCDVLELPFPRRSFDAVVMLDLLEHLSTADGISLLERSEEVATRKVVVLTPNGWVPQDEYGGNPLQRHQSAWRAADLVSRGYVVRGVSGHRVFRGYQAAYRRPVVAGAPLASVSELMVYRRPEKAFHLLAIKTIAD